MGLNSLSLNLNGKIWNPHPINVICLIYLSVIACLMLICPLICDKNVRQIHETNIECDYVKKLVAYEP